MEILKPIITHTMDQVMNADLPNYYGFHEGRREHIQNEVNIFHASILFQSANSVQKCQISLSNLFFDRFPINKSQF